MLSSADGLPGVLSLTRCRELLPASEVGISDSDLERLREQLYQLARAVLEFVDGDRRPAQRITSVAALDSDIDGA